MSIRKRTLLYTLIISIVCNASCSSSIERKLQGKWDNYFGGPTLEFKPDGSILVLEAGGQGKQIGSGKYKILDSETIEILWALNPDAPDRVKIKFNDQGGFVMTRTNGSQRVFVPAK